VSGYFGIARFDGGLIDPGLLERIARHLSFRGPDGTSVWTNKRFGGCFTRMDTNSAPQSRQQPVVLEASYFLWGDIRLDGRADLLAQLGRPHPQLVPDWTSEELLLLAWNRWGTEALTRVIGDFSFALWDAREQTLICARDFIGARPLYYVYVGGVFYFGNTLNSFHGVADISLKLDEQFIADFLIDGASPDAERTAFSEIHRLPAGHLLKFSKDGIEMRRFCKLPVEDPLEFPQEQDYVAAYLELLRQAVKDRLPRGSVALYLSGGLDSGSVSAIAAQIADAHGQKDQLRAFTLAWQPFFRDPEPEFAAISAQHLGIAHEVLTDPELIAFGGADSREWLVPEPDQEYFYLREKRLAEKIANHSSVVLGGDGGDDVLNGQSWPYLTHLWRKRDWQRIARDFGGYLWVNQRFPPLRAGLRGKLRTFLQPADKFVGYPEWLNPEFETRLSLKQRWIELGNPPRNPEHPLHPQAYQSLHDGYWASVLEMEDAGWNGVPLETRTPLLDLRVLRFMFRLPPLPWCIDKHLSRLMMTNRLPDAVVRRPKTPLTGHPLDYCSFASDWPSQASEVDRNRIGMFVNWDKWCETLSRPKGSLRWLNLRPVSLMYWLKAVENRMGIQ